MTHEWDEQDDRIRAVLGLRRHAPVPAPNRTLQLEYHKYLSARLSFPFQAEYQNSSDPLEKCRTITVNRLLDESCISESEGIMCEAQEAGGTIELPLCMLEMDEAEPNYQLTDDYSWWMFNDELEEEEDALNEADLDDEKFDDD